MAYTITTTAGATLASIADGTVNSTNTSLTLIGKNYAGYGIFLNENYIKLLENFYNSSAPTAPLAGQLWYDSTNNLLKVYNGTIWKPISSSASGTSQPASPVIGDLWYDSANAQLKVWSGSAFITVGPSYTTTSGTSGAVVEIEDVQTPVNGLSVHRGRVISGEVTTGSKSLAAIDLERRHAISRAHTATHMVHKAFREILGETATQAGSENSPGRFRFDFPSTGAVPDSVLNEVESRVNTLLLDNLAVTAETMTQDAAKKIGAMALFGEKYGDQVRVVSVGDWARELCGGTHVERSGQLGVVKLLSESSVGAGVRRVEALVGVDAYKFLAREHILLNSLTEIIKGARTEELPERISDLLAKIKDIEKELAGVRSAQAMGQIGALADTAQVLNGTTTVTAILPDGITGDDLRKIALDLKARAPQSAVALISSNEGKPVLVVAVSDAAKTAGLKAGALVKIGSTILGGGGGGKDDFAQGGGSDSSKSQAALSAITDSISGK